METGDLELQYLDALGPPAPNLRQAIIPSSQSEIPGSVFRLFNKIVLGTMIWLWGDEVGLTRGADRLRGDMWNGTSQYHLATLDSSERHMTITVGDSANKKLSSESDADALDTRPNHTICIFRDQDIVFSLVNLFGELESMVFVVDDSIADKVDEENPIVLIIKTTDNSVVKMTFAEYAEYKDRLTGDSVVFKTTIPVSRGDICGSGNKLEGDN